jgi:hypothetical protein
MLSGWLGVGNLIDINTIKSIGWRTFMYKVLRVVVL